MSQPVEYKDTYPCLRYVDNGENAIIKFLLTKSTEWSYEKEWRILTGPGVNGKGRKKYNNSVLNGIIFGCRARDEDINHVILACRDKSLSLKFYKSVQADMRYELEIQEIK
jgi:hypothetical protein